MQRVDSGPAVLSKPGFREWEVLNEGSACTNG